MVIELLGGLLRWMVAGGRATNNIHYTFKCKTDGFLTSHPRAPNYPNEKTTSPHPWHRTSCAVK
eukprot:8876757-Pyramimonas_sp.AAC.1